MIIKKHNITEEHKRKISASLKGRTKSKETRIKMSIKKKGRWIKENNPAWKGGITEKNKLIKNFTLV